MPELAAVLSAEKAITVAPETLSRFLIACGLSVKKTLRASEQDRLDLIQARAERKQGCQPKMREHRGRLMFIDETSTNTKMTKATGRCLKGQRLFAKAPLGHWATQTLIAGLKSNGLVAPWVINAPTNRCSSGHVVNRKCSAKLSQFYFVGKWVFFLKVLQLPRNTIPCHDWELRGYAN